MKNKKGFTLVELLAVIVILAVILVIAIPRILDVIDSSKLSSFESSARMIISDAEKQYAINKVNGIEEELSCENTSKLNNNEYSNCEITFDSEGLASIELTGSGKFEGLKCTGNSITLTCNTNSVSEDEEPSALANPVASYSCYNAKAGSSPYVLNYTGNCTVIDDGDGNWRVKFLTSGTLTISKALDVDIFAVGGGGNGGDGGSGSYGGAGGGGGHTTTVRLQNLVAGTSYNVTIGGSQAASSFGSFCQAQGGSGGDDGKKGASGGSGGSGGGGNGSYSTTSANRDGGYGGSNGGSGGSTSNGGATNFGGSGQGTTTREFGEANGTLYAGGGGGASCYHPNGDGYGGSGGSGGGGVGGRRNVGGSNGAANTGGGGGGDGVNSYGGAGGSGIVIIRNAR